MNQMIKLVFSFLFLFTSFSLLHAKSSQETPDLKDQELTVGVVQKEIRRGMAQAEVAEALGSPNIVTRDSDGKEVWIYDKIASEAHYSNTRKGIHLGAGAGGAPGSTLILGGIGGGYSKSSSHVKTTQKTLTVMIRFNKQTQVESFSYHSSKF